MSENINSKPINSHCPWSGKPVSSDSVTTYKGQSVGFCNPGCRDKFEAACQYFDDVLVQDHVTGRLGNKLAPITNDYQARHFVFNNWWDVAGVRFKVYSIYGQQHQGVDDGLLVQAKNYVNSHLPPALAAENPHHGSGYLIVHQGEVADWLLIHWWSDQDICLHLLAYQDAETNTFKSVGDRRFHACIWEQVIINHEKDAWVRMLQADDHAMDAYWQDVLPDGSY